MIHNKIITATALLAFVMLASGCSEKMTQHDTMSSKIIEDVGQVNSKAGHEQLAARYDKEAAILLEKAQEHEKLAASYKRSSYYPKRVWGGDAAHHCSKLAKKYQEAAAENSALADLHREQAENLNQ